VIRGQSQVPSVAHGIGGHYEMSNISFDDLVNLKRISHKRQAADQFKRIKLIREIASLKLFQYCSTGHERVIIGADNQN